jgi:FAD/FMN-containing dehydrogenase
MTRREILALAAAGAVVASCKRAGPVPLTLDDVSRLNEVPVRRVVQPRTFDDVRAAMRAAADDRLHVIAAGSRHSQGGHATARDGVVLDMRKLAAVTTVDTGTRRAVVQAGISWDALQRAINPKKLAVRTMQSSNIHGRDVNDGVFLKTVRRFTLLAPNGETIDVDRSNELFPFAIGGFGLFGVVLEVEIDLTDNAVMAHAARVLDAAEVPAYFAERIAGTDALFIARPSIAPSTFLKETIVETWTRTGEPVTPALLTLGEEENVMGDRLIFDASRTFREGKETRWALQRDAALKGEARVTRNNAMRPPVTPLAFLSHDAKDNTDIVQEYFIPVEGYAAFLSAAREVFLEEKTNVLGVTLRFVKGNDEAVLSFAPRDAFAFMFYTNQIRSPEGRAAAARMTVRLVDAAAAQGGRHYLTYQTWPSREQVSKAYPRLTEFAARKEAVDPEGLFRNGFYDAYLAPV